MNEAFSEFDDQEDESEMIDNPIMYECVSTIY